MNHVLVEQLSQITGLSEEEKQAIEHSFPIKTFGKGTFLLKEGQIARDAFLVIEGCVRKYGIEGGEEITSGLYTEGDSVADFNSLANESPSKYFFVCSETTTVAVINSEKEAALYKRFPRFEAICRVEFEKMMGQKTEETEAFTRKSPEEKYLQLQAQRPDLLQRVPQHQIASYLGIKPETLSRIRKRLAVK
jgi:CRP-like cAMP-binding protein